jgi:hypothetical protein
MAKDPAHCRTWPGARQGDERSGRQPGLELINEIIATERAPSIARQDSRSNQRSVL